MNRTLIASALVIAAFAVGIAQPASGLEVSVSSGMVFPSSPMTFADYWSMQAGGGIGVGVPVTESITLTGSFEYYRFTLDQASVTEGFNARYLRDIWVFNDVTIDPSAEPTTVLTAAVNVRIVPAGLTGWLSPYFTAGIGMMRFSLARIQLPTSSTLIVNGAPITMVAHQSITGGAETVPYFQLGMGFRARLAGSVGMFLEARTTNSVSKGLGTSLVPVTVGLTMEL